MKLFASVKLGRNNTWYGTLIAIKRKKSHRIQVQEERTIRQRVLPEDHQQEHR